MRSVREALVKITMVPSCLEFDLNDAENNEQRMIRKGRRFSMQAKSREDPARKCIGGSFQSDYGTPSRRT